MEYRVLGPLEVLDDHGHTVSIGGPKPRALVTVLLLGAPDPVSDDQIIDALWKDDLPANPRRAVQSYVARLRPALPIERSAAGYVLRVDPDDIDAVRFEQDRAVSTADRASVVEWRGRPYHDLGDWLPAIAAAMRLEELRVDMIERELERTVATDPAAAVAEAEALVLVHPERENLWVHLMDALARVGRATDALDAFQRARRRLIEDHGVEPGPALRDAEQRVLQGDDPRLVTSSAARSGTTGPGPVDLFGRDDDIERVLHQLSDARLVTLTGFGGIGKTSLAHAVLTHPDLAGTERCFVSFVGVSGSGVVPAVTEAVGTSQQPGRDPIEAIVTGLAQRELLLVLDNGEHVVAEVGELCAALVRGAPGVRILVTSREGLGIAHEQQVDLAPLAADGAHSPSVDLFLERMAPDQARPDDPGQRATIADICARLQGIPLAIELTATRTRSMGVDDIAQRLERILREPSGDSTRDPRHRTMGDVISWSVDLLSDAERVVHERACVFAGGFDLEAAEAICSGPDIDAADIWQHLDSLVSKSLLHAIPGPHGNRFRILEPLRDHALRAFEPEELAAIRDRHSQYFGLAAVRAEEGMQTRDEQRWVHWFWDNFDNLREANARAVAVGDVATALRVSVPFDIYAMYQHRFEVYAWIEAAMELPDSELDARADRAMAAVVMGKSFVDDLDGVAAWSKRLRDHADPGNPYAEMMYANHLGHHRGRWQEAVVAFRAIHPPENLMFRMNLEAHITGCLRRYDGEGSIENGRRAVAWAESTGALTLVADTVTVLSEMLVLERHFEEGYPLAVRGEQLAAETGCRWLEAQARLHQARALILGADPGTPVASLLRRTLVDSRTAGSRNNMWYVLDAVPHALAAAGLEEDAAVIESARPTAPQQWLRDGTQLSTPARDGLSDDILAKGAALASMLDFDGLVEFALASLDRLEAIEAAR